MNEGAGDDRARNPDGRSHPLGRLLRGSSVLLAGRMLSKVINFGVQIAIVRYLTREDFGAFAYGLALVLSGELVVKFGLGRGANRFVPYHAERGERAEVMGTLALVAATIGVLGGVGFAVLFLVAGLGWPGFPSGEGARVVLILSLLAPIQALDTICIQTLACFSRARAIFFRKHVLGPALRALAIAYVFVTGGDSQTLAMAYLAGGLLGLVVCLQLVWRELHGQGVLPLPLSAWRVPWKPLFRFSIPLISSDLVYITLSAVMTMTLMTSHGAEAVGLVQAVVPAAALNTLVMESFSILYLPGAMRLHVRGDARDFRDQHWGSAAWVAVLSFPIFAATFGVAPAVVPMLFGGDYAESAPLLAILAVSHYVGVCLGFNGETLQVFARTRALVGTNLVSVLVGTGLIAWLCPSHGPLGAAVAVALGRLTGTALRHVILLRQPGFESVPSTQKRIWLKIAAASTVVAVAGWILPLPVLAQLAVAAVASLWLLRSTARVLDIGRSFPELLRIPFLARVVGA